MTATDWQELANAGRTVEAIKTYREFNGVGLDEAKLAVERWLETNRPPSPSYQVCRRVAARVVETLDSYALASGKNLAYAINILPPDARSVTGLNTLYVLRTTIDHERLDLAVEVAMQDVPSDIRRVVVRSHLESGVPMVWVIETDYPTVQVHTGGPSYPGYYPGAQFDGGDVLPGFICKVAELFE